MDKLIQLESKQFNNNVKQTVNARELHKSLESRKDFSAWIKRFLKDFTKDEDYLVTQKGEQHPSGMKYKIEYYLTVDTAKNIAMMQRTAKGKQVREYFIEVERQYIEQQKPLELTVADLLLKAGQELKEKEQLNQELTQKLIKSQEEKTTLLERVSIEKSLGYQKTGTLLGLKPNKFVEWLRENDYIKSKDKKNLPYQKYIDNGVFEVKITENATNKTKHMQGLVTLKGQKIFAEIMATGELNQIKVKKVSQLISNCLV